MDPFFHRMPGIGYVPTLADATTSDMLELAHAKASENRMRVAEFRKEIWDEDFGGQIRARIRKWYSDALIADLVCRHTSMAFNPAKDIVKEVAVVYTHGAIRHLMGVSEDAQKQWTRLYQEDAIQTQSVFANRMAMLMGTVHTVPVVRRDRLLRETKLSNLISVSTSPSGTEADADRFVESPVGLMGLSARRARALPGRSAFRPAAPARAALWDRRPARSDPAPRIQARWR